LPVRLGTAPDSWGIWFPDDPRQTPWDRFLDEVVEAGYDAIELGPLGYLPAKGERLKEELGGRGISLSGAFVVGRLDRADSWSAIEATVHQTCELIVALGGDYLGIIDGQYTDPQTAEVIGPRELDDGAWRLVFDTVHRIGTASASYGVGALLHPHAETTIEYEWQIDRFLAGSDPQLVNLQLDVGHHAYRGGDPVRYLRDHRDRVKCLHLKSVDAEVRGRVERERIPWAHAVAMGIFSEPAVGVVDFVGLKSVIDDIGYDGWAIVEQDMYPAPFDKPLPIAKRTRKFFGELGYAPAYTPAVAE
jgi:inosose dehydratase